MYSTGRAATSIITGRGFEQISDEIQISQLVTQVLEQNPKEVASYLAGKETLSQWFFGQVMRQAKGHANPQLVQAELGKQLAALRD